MPAVELVQMIEPPPAAIRCGTLTTMVFQTPVRLVSRVSCQTCGVTSSQVWMVQMPALALTMFEPAELGHPVVDRGLQGTGVPHVGRCGHDPPVQGLHRLDRLGQLGLGRQRVAHRVVVPADVDRDDLGALLGEPDRVRPALPPRGPGDEGDLACYSSCHVCPYFLLVKPASTGSVTPVT